MYLGKVIGNIVSTSKQEGLTGFKLLIVSELNEREQETGRTEIAVDTVGAGCGETVIVSKGSSARNAEGLSKVPADAAIVGIVDTVELL